MTGDVSPGKFKKLVCVLGKSTISLIVDLGAKVSVLNQRTRSESPGDCLCLHHQWSSLAMKDHLLK